MDEYAVLEVLEDLSVGGTPVWRHSVAILKQQDADGALLDWHYGVDWRHARIVGQRLTLDDALVTAAGAVRDWNGHG